ncbi:MAG: FAD-dependent oxidoreductase, partial [Pseudoflavonifractor sp.]
DLSGEGILSGMTVKNVKTGALTQIEADPEDGVFGLFVFIGFAPFSKLFEGQIAMKDGYILTDDDMKTNLPGVFAAGDIRVKSLRQVVTATADGAIAATQAERYLFG